jgi:hypothetical protein
MQTPWEVGIETGCGGVGPTPSCTPMQRCSVARPRPAEVRVACPRRRPSARCGRAAPPPAPPQRTAASHHAPPLRHWTGEAAPVRRPAGPCRMRTPGACGRVRPAQGHKGGGGGGHNCDPSAPQPWACIVTRANTIPRVIANLRCRQGALTARALGDNAYGGAAATRPTPTRYGHEHGGHRWAGKPADERG